MGGVSRLVLRLFASSALLGSMAGGCAEAPSSEPRTGYWPSTPLPMSDAQVHYDAGADVDASAPSRDSGSAGPRDSGVGAFDSGGPDQGEPQDGATAAPEGGSGPELDASTEPPGEDAGTHDAAPQGCGGGTECAGTCVDLNSDPDHCGECGHACPGGAVCNGGTCEAPSDSCRYARFEGHDYLFCTDDRTWSSARNRCLGWGLDLAIVSSEAENTFLTQGEGQWIGMSDQDSQAFRWVPPGSDDSVVGAELGYTNWAEDEPNNTRTCEWVIVNCRTEDCGELRSDGSWNDRLCNVEQGYACESF